ncbi:MAG: hypothetical protein QW579_06340 [Desulfurococcaceae archaeon]
MYNEEIVYSRRHGKDYAKIYGEEVQVTEEDMKKLWVYDEQIGRKVPMNEYFRNVEVLKVFRKGKAFVFVVHYVTYKDHHTIEFVELVESKYFEQRSEQQ